jgi:hypothetical protein
VERIWDETIWAYINTACLISEDRMQGKTWISRYHFPNHHWTGNHTNMSDTISGTHWTGDKAGSKALLLLCLYCFMWEQFINCIGYITPNVKVIVNHEFQGIWKELVIAIAPIASRGWIKSLSPSISISQPSVHIRNRDLPNTTRSASHYFSMSCYRLQ